MTKEYEGDEVRRILIDELHNTFITPFDREDIFNLSLNIDERLDYALTPLEEMQLLKIKADEHLTEMVTLNRQGAEELALAIRRLSSDPRVAGEMVFFDRSWYNQAVVERVMGFCTEE